MAPTMGYDAMGNVVQGMAPAIAYQQVVNTTYSETITTHTFTRVDPGEYEGAEVDGKRDGFGNCKWADESHYEGRWKENVRWGKGKFTTPNGAVYDGEWVNDIREGAGTQRLESGKILDGTWEKDRLNGQGTITREGKDPVEVIFSEDVIIEQKTQFGTCDYFYFVSCIIMMIIFYVAIPLGLITKSTPMFGLCVVWVIYLIASCSTNSTKYISNTVDVAQVFINIEAAIEARPDTELGIQNYHMETHTVHYKDSEGNDRTR